MLTLTSLSRAPLLAAILLLAACSSNPNIIQVDPAVQGYIQVEEIRQRVNENGLLDVQVTAKNTTDKPLLLYYQFDWLDDAGRTIPSLLGRKTRLTADRLRWFTINGVGPTPDVQNFRLYIEERAP